MSFGGIMTQNKCRSLDQIVWNRPKGLIIRQYGKFYDFSAFLEGLCHSSSQYANL